MDLTMDTKFDHYTATLTVESDHHQRWWLERCEPLKAVGKPSAT